MERYLNFGVAGEVRNLFKQVFDLPRCAPIKVALHSFMGRSVPSFEALLSELSREAHPIGAAERR